MRQTASAFRLATLLGAAAAWFTPAAAHAQWMDLATISSTLGNNAGYVCTGGGRTDLGCSLNAPYITSAGNVGIGTTTPSLKFEVSGSAIINNLPIRYQNNADTSTSIGTNNSNHLFLNAGSSNHIYFTKGGYSTPYALMTIKNDGRVGIGSVDPSTSLEVSGTLRISNGGESCNNNRLGALRYTSGVFSVCANTTNGWEPLATTTSSSTPAISSGLSGSIVFRDEYGYLNARNDIAISSTTGSIGIGAGAPAYAGNNALFATGSIYGSSFNGTHVWLGLGGSVNWSSLNSTNRITADNVGAADSHIRISVSGTEAMRIVSTGNIGMGTTTPSATLHIKTTTANSSPLLLLENAGTNSFSATGLRFKSDNANQFFTIQFASTAATPSGEASFTNNASGGLSFDAAYSGSYNSALRFKVAGTEYMRLANTGNIGIRTTSPTAALHISGSLQIANGGEACDVSRTGAIRYNGTEFSICQNTSNGWEPLATTSAVASADRITSSSQAGVIANNTGYISLTTGGVTGTAYFTPASVLVNAGISSTGGVSATSGYFTGPVGIQAAPSNFALNVGGQVQASSYKTSTGGGYTFYNDTTAGIYGHSTERYLQFQTSSTEAMRIISTGYVGIGTTAPTSTLTVSGTIRAASPGSSGRIFATGSNAGFTASSDGGRTFNISADDGTSSIWMGTTSNHSFVIRTANTSRMALSASGQVGIGTTAPSTTLDVVGTLKVASGGESCDTLRLGAIRYTGGVFSICQNTTNGWEPLATTGATANADRITSNSQAGVTANSTGYISLTTGGVTGTAYFQPDSVLVNAGISTTGAISGTNGYFSGNVGIGTTAPSSSLHISGNSGIAIGTSSSINLKIIPTGVGSSAFETGLANGRFSFRENNSTSGYMVVSRDGTYIGSQLSATPSATLHVSGTLRLANGGESCDTNRLGAIRYTGSAFSVCANTTNGWEPLATTTSTTNIAINTGTSGSIVFRDENGILKARNDFAISSTNGYVGIGTSTPDSNLHISDTNARLRVGGSTNGYLNIDGSGNSANMVMTGGSSTNLTMSAATASFAINTGASNYIGTTTSTTYSVRSNNLNRMLVLSSGQVNVVNSFSVNTGNSGYYPSTSLDISGTLKLSDSGETCDTNRLGAFKYQSGAFYICQNTTNGWEPLATSGATANADRITSNSQAGVTANSTGYISLTTGGVTGTAYFTPASVLVNAGISSTGSISGTTGYFNGTINATGNITTTGDVTANRFFGSDVWLGNGNAVHWGNDAYITANGINQTLALGAVGTNALTIVSSSKIGIGTDTPAARLDISGTLKLANGGESCDSTHLGALKYQSNAFYICQNTTNGWEPLATTGANSVIDRITSNSQAGVTANSTGYISLTTGGVTGTAYFQPNSVLVNAGISSTGGISGTTGYFDGDFNIASTSSSSTRNVTIRGGGASVLSMYSYGNANPAVNFYRTSGTEAVPVAINANNTIMALGAYGYNGSAYINNASIRMYAGDTLNGGRIAFLTRTEAGVGPTARMQIDPHGLVIIGSAVQATVPSTSLHVAGTLKIATESSATLQTCDTNRLGAMRYTGGAFSVCQNTTNGWEPLATTGTSSTVDRITSNSQAGVIANSTGYISLTTGGTSSAYFNPSGTLFNLGVSSTGTIYAYNGLETNSNVTFNGNGDLRWVNNNTRIRGYSSGTDSYMFFVTSATEVMRIISTGYVGIGTSTPSSTLHISNSDAIVRFTTPGGRSFILGASDVTSNSIIGTVSNHALSFVTTNTARMSISNIGNVNIANALAVGMTTGNSNPASTTLHVSGTLRIANGGESCDSDRLGSIRYTGSAFSVCANTSNGWEPLSTASATTTFATLTDVSVSLAGSNIYGPGSLNGAVVGYAGNTAFGINALSSTLNTGSGNSGFGLSALKSIRSGDVNTAVGSSALSSLTNGANNTAVGGSALNSTLIGSLNAAVGRYAGANNTGSYNSVLGAYSLRYKSTGGYNTSVGYGSLQGVDTVSAYSGNTALGAYAGQALTTGNSNTLVGYNAGGGITTGENNIVIGHQTTPYSNTGSYQLNIGNAIWGDLGSGTGYANKIGINVASPTTQLEVSGTISATAILVNGQPVGSSTPDRIISGTTQIIANTNTSISLVTANTERMVIGTTGNVSIGANDTLGYKLYVAGDAYSTGTWGASDGRFKDNVHPMTGLLNGVSKLRPVTFTWNAKAPVKNDTREQVGLIAQDVEKIYPDLVRTNTDGYKAVAYDKLSVLLLGAVKELKSENDTLKAQNQAILKRLEALEAKTH